MGSSQDFAAYVPSTLCITHPLSIYPLLPFINCFSSSHTTGHFPPGSQPQDSQHWQNNVGTGKVSRDGPIGGLAGAAPHSNSFSWHTPCLPRDSKWAHRTAWGLHSWNLRRAPTIFWPFAHAGVYKGLALGLLLGVIRNYSLLHCLKLLEVCLL